MLIEFSVKNFRSIKERQTLSMVASNRDKSLPDHLIDPQVKGLSNTKLLKSTAIYGANASGKSNIFKAMQFMRDFVVNSATDIKPGQETGVVPFRLNSETKKEPSEFEIIFIHEGVRYQYGFILDKKQVYEEWLTAYPSGLPQRWFTRVWDSERNAYEWKFSSLLKGEKENLKNITKVNSLFLSVAAQFNLDQLSTIYNWCDEHFIFIDFTDLSLTSGYTASLIDKNEALKVSISSLLKQADLGVTDINIKHMNAHDLRFPEEMPDEIKEKILHDLKDSDIIMFNLTHLKPDTKEQISFDNDEESSGTLKFFSLLGPLFSSLQDGDTIFIDEIGANMHPMLISRILEYFQSNSTKAQLIFTTHDTTQLNQDTLRRDQVWFTEKNEEGATILYPLTDFKPRPDESLQKGYLAGRYGAIPYLGDFKF